MRRLTQGAAPRAPLLRLSLALSLRQDVRVPNGGHSDLFRTRPVPDGAGVEIVFYDVRTGEERAIGIVDDHTQAQAFISGALAAIEASGAYARGYAAGLELRGG
jgi:hypothetical protein